MLRLNPSELTVTPDDVDETFRRLAQRQQARAAAASSQRRARHSGRPPPPRLQPGAQRFVRDAITDLGNIPILRPHPQQATIAHVDADSDGSGETLDFSHQAQSSPDSTSVPSYLEQPVSTSSVDSSRHVMRLPFRLARPRRDLETEQDPPSSPTGQTYDSDGTLVEPATSSAGPATPAGLRGGASRPQENRIRSVGQESLRTLSPLHDTLVTHQPEHDSASSDEDQPVRYLQGYFERATHKYTFQELMPLAPHTEPCRKTNQPRLHSRSQSSTDAPPARLFAPTSNAPHPSVGNDVFWSPPALPSQPTPKMRDSQPRRHSSEMSNASLAYSYYELPETRHSSGELPVQGYDGVAHTRETSRGTYRSVRLSEAQVLGDPTSGFSPGPALSGASPLPTQPYARPPAVNVGARYQSAIQHRASHDSAGPRIHPDAVAAAMQNRVSPLEALSAHIGRESQRLGGYQAFHQQGGHFGAGSLAYNYTGSATSPYSQYRSPYDPHSSTYGSQSFAYGLYPGAFGQAPAMMPSPLGASALPMAMADDPYTRGVSANAGRPYNTTARSFSAQPGPAANYAAPSLPRSTHGWRSGQRSSENGPVGSSAQRPRTGQASQVQDQVSAFEQMNNVAQPR